MMKIKLEKELCVGCGLCEENVPELFSTGDYTADLKSEDVPERLEKAVLETIEDCPTDAISISEKSAES